MNKNQEQLLKLAQERDISSLSLRAIGREIGIKNPQTVKYHLNQLIDKGLLIYQKNKKAIIRNRLHTAEKLLSLPILASANCGMATQIADEELEGYLKVSPKIAERSNSNGLIVVRAIGSSLDDADIKGKSIENGDYVVVDCNNKNPIDGDYVLSIIDGVANMKRFYKNEKEIRLVSESTSEIPPIVIHEDDNYMISGVILMVVKNKYNEM